MNGGSWSRPLECLLLKYARVCLPFWSRAGGGQYSNTLEKFYFYFDEDSGEWCPYEWKANTHGERVGALKGPASPCIMRATGWVLKGHAGSTLRKPVVNLPLARKTAGETENGYADGC